MISVIASLLTLVLIGSWVIHKPRSVADLVAFRARLAVRGTGLALLGVMLYAAVQGETSAWSLLFVLWPYGFFLYVYPRESVQRLVGRLSRGLIFIMVALGTSLPEIGVALDAGRAVGEHLLSVGGFYLGLGLTILGGVWLGLPVGIMMLFGGLAGVIFEQNFAIFGLLFSNPVAFLLISPSVFATYALYFLWGRLYGLSADTYSRFHVLVFVLMCALLPLGVWLATNLMLEAAGITAPVLSI